MKKPIKGNKPYSQFDEKLKRKQWRVRFRLNNVQYRFKADTENELQKIVDNVRAQENRENINKKYGANLDVVRYSPTLEELFDKALKKIANSKHRQLSKRVSESRNSGAKQDCGAKRYCCWNSGNTSKLIKN